MRLLVSETSPAAVVILAAGEGSYADNFHIIGMEWTPEQIAFYVDDKVYYTADISHAPYVQKEQYLLLNTAVGGDWPGSPDETTVFPQKYIVDWVRVYQKTE